MAVEQGSPYYWSPAASYEKKLISNEITFDALNKQLDLYLLPYQALNEDQKVILSVLVSSCVDLFVNGEWADGLTVPVRICIDRLTAYTKDYDVISFSDVGSALLSKAFVALRGATIQMQRYTTGRYSINFAVYRTKNDKISSAVDVIAK